MPPARRDPSVRPARRAYLGLGSNLGDRAAHLQEALDALADTPGVSVVAVSPVYESDPVGGPPQPVYLNAVVAADTTLAPRALLEVGQRIEKAARRHRGERFGPRTLDVDVLTVGNEIVDEPDLTIPHPRMFERHFVLAPLADLAPEVVAVPRRGWRGVRPARVALSLPSTR